MLQQCSQTSGKSEDNSRGGHDDVVLVRVSCQGGVVGLDVQLEITLQTIMLQEPNYTHSIYKTVTSPGA